MIAWILYLNVIAKATNIKTLRITSIFRYRPALLADKTVMELK